MRDAEVTIRTYEDSDLDTCRDLWCELVEQHRELYADPNIGGEDPGAEFDDYLGNEKRIATWVAEREGQVVGLTGILADDERVEIEPVIVHRAARGHGIGSLLIGCAVDEAERREIRFLSIRPVARNQAAIACFHEAGFRLLGHVEMFRDLRPDDDRDWKAGMSLHGFDFGF